MTAYKDMNTRRLKRAYLRAVKAVWYHQRGTKDFPHSPSLRSDLTAAERRVTSASAELRHRGWSA